MSEPCPGSGGGSALWPTSCDSARPYARYQRLSDPWTCALGLELQFAVDLQVPGWWLG